MVDSYCPRCRIRLHYCGGDVHHCRNCDKFYMTDFVLDSEGYYLLRRCPEHGTNTGGFYLVGEVKHCIKCNRHMLRLKPESVKISPWPWDKINDPVSWPW